MLGNWDRGLAALIAAVLAGNALAMLLAPLPWYDFVPGVPATGPFNPHFVRDIGAAYLAAAGGLAWFAVRPAQGWPALMAGAAFLGVHAAIHVYDTACGGRLLADVWRDLPGVYALAAVSLTLALMRKPKGA